MVVEEIQTPQHQALVRDMGVVMEHHLQVLLTVPLPQLTPEVVEVEVVEVLALVMVMVVMVDQVL